MRKVRKALRQAISQFDTRAHRQAGRRALFDEAWYRSTSNETGSTSPPPPYKAGGAREGRAPSPYFSPAWYEKQRPEVALEDQLADYSSRGWKGGHSPHPAFDTRYYLETNPDVARAKVEPLRHYVEFGWREGRNPHPAFDVRWTIAQAKDHERDPLRQMLVGELQASPHPLFDLPAHSGASSTGTAGDALVHYLTVGWKLGDRPSAWFDVQWYLSAYPDIREAGIEPLSHYLRHGWRENRRPNPLFEPAEYLGAYPDVQAAGVEPLTHYVRYGRHEGRSPTQAFDPLWFTVQYQLKTGTVIAPADAFGIYLSDPAAAEVSPHPLFDPAWYHLGRETYEFSTPLAEYLHRPAIGASPHALVDEKWYRETLLENAHTPALLHYLQHGHAWGWPPHPLFDEHFYKSESGCTIAGALHYAVSGEREGRRPNPYFSPYFYKATNTVLREVEHAPLAHFIHTGDAQGLRPSVEFSPALYRSRHTALSHERRSLRHYMLTGRYAGIDPSSDNRRVTRHDWLSEHASDGKDVSLDRTILVIYTGDQPELLNERLASHDDILPGSAAAKACTPKDIARALEDHPEATMTVLLDASCFITGSGLTDMSKGLQAAPDIDVIAPKVSDRRGMVVGNTRGASQRAGEPLDRLHPDISYRRRTASVSGPVVGVRSSLLNAALANADVPPVDQLVERISALAATECEYVPSIEAFLDAHWSGAASFGKADAPRNRRMLYIDSTIPRPDQDAGSDTAYRVLSMLRAEGWDITFLPDSEFRHDGRYTEALQELGVRAFYAPYVKYSEDFIACEDEDFDVVFLARVYSGGRHFDAVRKRWPKAKVIFNTVDLHYLREQREATLKDDAEGFKRSLDVKRLELRLIRDADATIVLSEAERHILDAEGVGRNVVIVPPVFDADQPLAYKPLERAGIFFLGGYAHAPNVDAIDYFMRDVWPLILEKRSDIVFSIVGANAPERFRDYESDNVKLVGFVPELGEFIAHQRLNVAPLRYGAGVKVKVIAGLAYGVPCVATPIAVEGSGVEDGDGVVMAQDARTMADAILRLYGDDEALSALSQAGLALVDRRYSLKSVKAIYQDILG